MDCSLLFIYRKWVGNTFSKGNWVDETNIKYLLYLYLNSRGLLGLTT
jgi:hypothetical protein